MRNLKVRAGRPLVSERNLFGISEIAVKNFQVLDFLERDFHGAHKEPYGSGCALFGERAESIWEF